MRNGVAVRSKLVLLIALLGPSAAARQAGIHVEEAKLIGADTSASDGLGSSVAISGSTAILGAPTADPNERGAAYVFVRANGGWTQQAKLLATLGTHADFDHFGSSVAIHGDVAVVGAPDWGTEDGHVHVFRRSGTTWSAQAVLGPPTTGYFYRFGYDVAVHGTKLAASAPYFGGQFEGAIAIYAEVGGTWTFETWITGGWTGPNDYMGEDIDLSPSGTIMRVIATTRTHGAVTYSDATGLWQPRFAVVAPGVDAVAAGGSTAVLAVSTAPVGGFANAGAAYVYFGGVVANQSPVSQGSLIASDASAGARFGSSLDIDGGVIVVGAPFESGAGLANRGAAYVFERAGSTWYQRAKLVASDAAPGDHYGRRVAASSQAVIVGAPDDSHAQGAAAGSAYANRVGFPTVTYCTAGVSSGNCVASMSSSGIASASLATPFSLQATDLDGQRYGLIFYGVSGPSAVPWGGSSYLCVKSPLQRSRALLAGGTVGACDGSLVLDWNLFAAQHPTALGQPFGAGDELWSQAWYRDPASLKTTQLSDALAFVLAP